MHDPLDILADRVLATCAARGDQHAHVQLTETVGTPSLDKVTIVIGNGDWLAFHPEAGRDQHCRNSAHLVVDQGVDHHKACDGVLVGKFDGTWIVFFLELKSEGHRTLAEEQFVSTHCVWDYVCAVLQRMQAQNFPAAPQVRYVLLQELPQRRSMRKRRSQRRQPDAAVAHATVRRMYVTNRQKIGINELLAA